MSFVFVLGVVVIVMLAGLDNTPRWWAQLDTQRADDASVIERAERVENAITTQLTAVRDPDDPRWNAKISDQQANAWVKVRLRETIVTHMGEDAWDNRVEQMLMRFDEDRITIGARVRHRSGTSIVSAQVVLELDDQGELWADARSIRIGTTGIPAWAVGILGGDAMELNRIHLGPGALELGDGRTARLVAIRVREQWVDVAVETVPVTQ
jgi:hypothetical protein